MGRKAKKSRGRNDPDIIVSEELLLKWGVTNDLHPPKTDVQKCSNILIGRDIKNGHRPTGTGIIPSPLQAGEELRMTPDGKTRLYNPNLDVGPGEGIDGQYQDAVVALVKQNGKGQRRLASRTRALTYNPTVPDANEKDIRHAARQYFVSLRKSHRAQTTTEGKAQQSPSPSSSTSCSQYLSPSTPGSCPPLPPGSCSPSPFQPSIPSILIHIRRNPLSS
ncbi:hypothetical protein JAAARDRAFT_200301 [Jaapia argillacea MUCL 33604]|uniref:Uncharacterized protein n=1 Tax=Jaapia argillacea MUCL 33604 TaxID=933084 RepID=A0A067P5L9_9AGAM|nr:hypothetical protein JAAARDRAFT_200301 [Jaapia argillacea MUCL 33604]